MLVVAAHINHCSLRNNKQAIPQSAWLPNQIGKGICHSLCVQYICTWDMCYVVKCVTFIWCIEFQVYLMKYWYFLCFSVFMDIHIYIGAWPQVNGRQTIGWEVVHNTS